MQLQGKVQLSPISHRQNDVAALYDTALKQGCLTSDDQRFFLRIDGPRITVREADDGRPTNRLVAFSAMAADFEQSLDEFIFDYFT